jgi:predicted transcriptional regulator/transcriptional regulator with XRE-family HTH domain
MPHNLTGLKVREARKRLRLTQGELARRAGISASYLNLIEMNKRPLAEAMLRKLADGLGMDRRALDGEAERRLAEELSQIASDPAFSDIPASPETAEELVGRQPRWAALILKLYRVYLDERQAVLALADRLNRDPFLGDSVHRMLTNVTAIRSAAQILQSLSDAADNGGTDDADRERFLSIVASDSEKLAQTAQSIVAFFDNTSMRIRSTTPMEQVDAFFFDTGNHYPELERLASDFLAACPAGETATAAAHRVLAAKGGLPAEPPAAAARETWWFRLVEEAIRDDTAPAIQAIVESHPALASEQSRDMAAAALHSYAAAAVLMPYQAFLQTAERHRYDLDALSRLFGVSYEQAAHRLATLRRPGAEGVRFAFMRSDASGYVTKRLPLPRLSLPRYGNACPLWVIHAAFQAPGATVRGFGELPSGEQFLFFARTVEKRPSTATLPRHLLSVMLACSASDARRVAYGDGIDRATATAPIGTICRLCPRPDCGHRQEAPLIA